ncbi:MAG: DUF1549 domain-containing protein, partial [Planctomycetaceae bacterium]|nr:DUF1549 domain-containing protein [Planctomycetaceae bacterium]
MTKLTLSVSSASSLQKLHFASTARRWFGVRHLLLLLAVLSSFRLSLADERPDVSAAGVEFFESRIRPVLVRHCYECHSAATATPEAGLRLDDRAAVLQGGDSGPAVVPGHPTDSLLMAALRYESLEMPPKAPLPANVVNDFERWIRDGAVDPRTTPATSQTAADEVWDAVFKERTQWWSLQAPADITAPNPTPCTPSEAAWTRNPVDRFLLARLQQTNLQPAKVADAEAIARRLAFVLTGLPLSAERATAFSKEFLQDDERAIRRLTDELLQSPHYGERFARHWMDVVRYTDTYGYEWDNPAKGSWEYRDYLIRAFNADIGFDQLIREQIAGDLLQTPRTSQNGTVNESIIGPMFYHLGEHRHGTSLDFNGIHQEMIN